MVRTITYKKNEQRENLLIIINYNRKLGKHFRRELKTKRYNMSICA